MIYTVIYFILLGTIFAGYFLSESTWQSGNQLIIGLSAIKFLLISFFFMGLVHASMFWKILLPTMIAIFVIFNIVV